MLLGIKMSIYNDADMIFSTHFKVKLYMYLIKRMKIVYLK